MFEIKFDKDPPRAYHPRSYYEEEANRQLQERVRFLARITEPEVVASLMHKARSGLGDNWEAAARWVLEEFGALAAAQGFAPAPLTSTARREEAADLGRVVGAGIPDSDPAPPQAPQSGPDLDVFEETPPRYVIDHAEQVAQHPARAAFEIARLSWKIVRLQRAARGASYSDLLYR